jgi:hypothetical protein
MSFSFIWLYVKIEGISMTTMYFTNSKFWNKNLNQQMFQTEVRDICESQGTPKHGFPIFVT